MNDSYDLIEALFWGVASFLGYEVFSTCRPLPLIVGGRQTSKRCSAWRYINAAHQATNQLTPFAYVFVHYRTKEAENFIFTKIIWLKVFSWVFGEAISCRVGHPPEWYWRGMEQDMSCSLVKSIRRIWDECFMSVYPKYGWRTKYQMQPTSLKVVELLIWVMLLEYTTLAVEGPDWSQQTPLPRDTNSFQCTPFYLASSTTISSTPSTSGISPAPPIFCLVVAPRKGSSFSLKVIKTKLKRSGNQRKLEFQVLSQTYIEITESTSNLEHISNILKQRWGE